MAIRNFLVALKLFLNAKSSLCLWSKWQISQRKWFLIPICSLSNRSLLPSLTVNPKITATISIFYEQKTPKKIHTTYLFWLRDHPYITSVKALVGSRKWPLFKTFFQADRLSEFQLRLRKVSDIILFLLANAEFTE